MFEEILDCCNVLSVLSFAQKQSLLSHILSILYSIIYDITIIISITLQAKKNIPLDSADFLSGSTLKS